MVTTQAVSPKLQNITVDIAPGWAPKTRMLYLEANIRFKATITDLRIYFLEDVLKKYTLPEFISLFPVLTSVRVSSNQSRCSAFNVSRVFKAAPQLQELVLSYGTCYRS